MAPTLLMLRVLGATMSQDGSIKIRTLPRQNETKKGEKSETQQPAPQPPRWIIYVGTVSVVLLLAALFIPAGQKAARRNLSSTVAKVEPAKPSSSDSVNRHLQDTAAKREMMVRVREMENMKVSGNLEADEYASTPEQLNQGVQFDQEDSAERVYADLNEDAQTGYDNELPEDKINARLATRRWVNQLEREERRLFIRNYIRNAYEQGYEVQIDKNLIVVGVKKINKVEKVNIESVLDKLAQQGL